MIQERSKPWFIDHCRQNNKGHVVTKLTQCMLFPDHLEPVAGKR